MATGITFQLLEAASHVVAIITSITFLIYRERLFKGSLHNRQVDHLLDIRQRLVEIWKEIYFVFHTARNSFDLRKSLLDIEKETPDSWLKFKDFQKNCDFVESAFSLDENGMLPTWFRPKAHKDFFNTLNKLRPFTLSKLSKMKDEDVVAFQNCVLNKVIEIDSEIRRRS